MSFPTTSYHNPSGPSFSRKRRFSPFMNSTNSSETLYFPSFEEHEMNRDPSSRAFSRKRMLPGSRFGHNVRRPEQFVCPNSDTICPNSDKICLMIVMSKFLFTFNTKRDSSLPSGSWIVLFWLPAKTLSLKRLQGVYSIYCRVQRVCRFRWDQLQ